MKKIIFSGFMGAMLAVPAFATGEDALTTKNYVDSGLRAVYNKAKTDAATYTDNAVSSVADDVSALDVQINGTEQNPGGLAGDVLTLQNTIGDGTTSGIAKDVADLQNTVGDTSTVGSLAYKVNQLENNPSTQYSAGAGISITSGEIGIDGLAATSSDGKLYGFKNGELAEVTVAQTWDPDFDFTAGSNSGSQQSGGGEQQGGGEEPGNGGNNG